jgi:AraC-like DNA-binding protein
VETVRAYHENPPTVRALAASAGLTARSVERILAHEVGLAPRSLLRIARVQRALALARSSPALPWGTIAARAGYHDQPHLVREFRALVGRTPSAVRADPGSLTETLRDRSG